MRTGHRMMQTLPLKMSVTFALSVLPSSTPPIRPAENSLPSELSVSVTSPSDAFSSESDEPTPTPS